MITNFMRDIVRITPTGSSNLIQKVSIDSWMEVDVTDTTAVKIQLKHESVETIQAGTIPALTRSGVGKSNGLLLGEYCPRIFAERDSTDNKTSSLIESTINAVLDFCQRDITLLPTELKHVYHFLAKWLPEHQNIIPILIDMVSDEFLKTKTKVPNNYDKQRNPSWAKLRVRYVVHGEYIDQMPHIIDYIANYTGGQSCIDICSLTGIRGEVNYIDNHPTVVKKIKFTSNNIGLTAGMFRTEGNLYPIGTGATASIASYAEDFITGKHGSVYQIGDVKYFAFNVSDTMTAAQILEVDDYAAQLDNLSYRESFQSKLLGMKLRNSTLLKPTATYAIGSALIPEKGVLSVRTYQYFTGAELNQKFENFIQKHTFAGYDAINSTGTNRLPSVNELMFAAGEVTIGTDGKPNERDGARVWWYEELLNSVLYSKPLGASKLMVMSNTLITKYQLGENKFFNSYLNMVANMIEQVVDVSGDSNDISITIGKLVYILGAVIKMYHSVKNGRTIDVGSRLQIKTHQQMTHYLYHTDVAKIYLSDSVLHAAKKMGRVSEFYRLRSLFEQVVFDFERLSGSGYHKVDARKYLYGIAIAKQLRYAPSTQAEQPSDQTEINN